MIQDTLSRILKNRRVLFYPSSGPISDEIIGLDYDVYVCADRDLDTAAWEKHSRCNPCRTESFEISGYECAVYQAKDKWVVGFGGENRVMLSLLRASGAELSAFAGFNDGCCEGGNSYCVNALPFFRSVLHLANPAGFDYWTDHGIFNRSAGAAYSMSSGRDWPGIAGFEDWSFTRESWPHSLPALSSGWGVHAKFRGVRISSEGVPFLKSASI
ncbi:MAG: hypothetical protein WCO60_16830 [Verrucomicrobiota bacterium]